MPENALLRKYYALRTTEGAPGNSAYELPATFDEEHEDLCCGRIVGSARRPFYSYSQPLKPLLQLAEDGIFGANFAKSSRV